MAKTTAPLLSFGGSGQIGKTQVYSSWRGVKYARRYVVPNNPQSSSQTKTRGAFSWLNATWKLLDGNVQAVWTLFAKGRPLTNRNAWIKSNLSALRGTDASPATDLSGMVVSPGANAGVAPAAIATADHGDSTLDVTLTAPDLPSGWAITKSHVVVFKQQEADTGTDYSSFYDSVASPGPYVSNIDTGAGTFAAFGFFEFTKDDGSTAYGISLYAEQVVA